MLGRVIPESVLVEAETARELALRGKPSFARHPGDRLQRAGRSLFWFHGDFAHGGYYIRRRRACSNSR